MNSEFIAGHFYEWVQGDSKKMVTYLRPNEKRNGFHWMYDNQKDEEYSVMGQFLAVVKPVVKTEQDVIELLSSDDDEKKPELNRPVYIKKEKPADNNEKNDDWFLDDPFYLHLDDNFAGVSK